MKTLIPYILAYIIIAAGTATYSHFTRHAQNTHPYFTFCTKLSHDELVAKLQQAGIPEASVFTVTVRPAPLATQVYHFAFYAVLFAIFVGLTLLFQRAFRTNVTNHDHARRWLSFLR
jgi:hypothetical protein